MASPSDPSPAVTPPEDSFLELLAETLENLDRVPRGQFLQRFFKTIAQLDLSETVSSEYWDQILERRRQLADTLGKPISLKAAMVDVLASSTYLRVPILMEYDDLKKLQINAATDPLTGLYNRRLFEEHFEKELNRALRYNQHLALVILDLHQFKEVNDRFGHPQGDLFLRTAAGTLRKSLRTSDYAFRIGGDEFALLLVHSDSEQANTLARRIRANFGYGGAEHAGQCWTRLGLWNCRISRGWRPERRFGAHCRPTFVRDEALERGGKAQAAVPQQAPPPPIKASPPAPMAHSESAHLRIQRHPPRRPPRPGEARTRKWERVSLAGTRAYAQLADDPQKTARVIDLGYGGLALEMEVVRRNRITVFGRAARADSSAGARSSEEVVSGAGKRRSGKSGLRLRLLIAFRTRLQAESCRSAHSIETRF